MRKTLSKLFVIWLLLTYSGNVNAQWSGGSPPPPDDPDYAPGTPVPIDGGLTALLVAGGAMGYRAMKKKNEDA